MEKDRKLLDCGKLTRERLVNLLEKSGFKVIKVHSSSTLGSLINKFNNNDN